MTSNTNIGKCTAVLAVSLLTGGVAPSVLADDAGYHAKEFQKTRAQTGVLLQVNDDILLGDARDVSVSGSSATTPNERIRDGVREDEQLTSSEKHWERAEQHSDYGP